MENQYYYENQISIKEIIEKLLRDKMLIAVIAFVVFLASVIYAYVVVTPVFNATVVLNTKTINTTELNANTIESIVNSTGAYPSLDVTSYIEQLNAPELIDKVIKALELKNGDEYVTVGSFKRMVTVRNPDKTNIIKISVTSSDKVMAANIANTYADMFINYMNDYNSSQSLETAEVIKEQLVIEEANLAEKTKALSDYYGESINLEILRNDISSLVAEISNGKAKLISLEYQNEVNRKNLETLAKESGLSSSISEELEINVNSENVSESIIITSLDSDKLIASLVTVELVDLQNNLIRGTIEYDELITYVDSLEKKLADRKKTLVEEEYKYNNIQQEVNLANQTFDAYQVRYKEALVAAASKFGNDSINISSHAIVPESPIAPRKVRIALTGLVLGLVLGVSISLFKSYWKS